MPHSIDGFDLNFTARTSWKAERRHLGHLLDIVPVTWTKGWRRDPDSKESFLEVWYQDQVEMEKQRTNPMPFVIALAIAENYTRQPREFKEFRGLFEVVSTGVALSENSIETKVLKRAIA